MNDPNDERLATAAAAADLDRPTTLPGVRARQPTLIGVAPAAPIVTGRHASLPEQAALAGSDEPIEAPQGAPASRARPRSAPAAANAASVPLLPRAPKQSLDAIAIGKEALPVVCQGRRGKGVIVVTLVAVLAIAIAATMAARRVLQTRPAAPPLAASSAASPSATPQSADVRVIVHDAPAAVSAAAPNVALSPLRPEKRTAKPPRKNPVHRKHPPKPGPH